MMIPMIHSNGTSKNSLLEAIEEAHAAIGEAMRKMALVSPNGRDYYPQGPDAFYKARDQHMEQYSKLLDMRAYLEALAEGIDAQGRR